MRRAELVEEIARKEKHLNYERKPWQVIPEVVEWQRDIEVTRARRKFLVLDGPSRMGKTEFVRSLIEPVAILELNCASCLDPPLASFEAHRHRLILMDEGTVEMVCRNRKLFQCPNSFVQLGMSATNCHSYEVYLNNCLVVVCSNNWRAQLEKAPYEAGEWVVANQVYLYVSEPLWIRE